MLLAGACGKREERAPAGLWIEKSARNFWVEALNGFEFFLECKGNRTHICLLPTTTMEVFQSFQLSERHSGNRNWRGGSVFVAYTHKPP